jgi:predicted DNA-binding transcriptional regulator AlpA
MTGYYTVGEVCGKFKVSRETIRRWERKQWFPLRTRLSDHPRGRCGFPISEVEAWDLARRNARLESPSPKPHSDDDKSDE